MAGKRRRMVWTTLVGLIVVSWVMADLRYPGRPPVRLPPASCDPQLWNHVYRPSRLVVIEPCAAVEGRVVSIHRQPDGDLHINLDPDDRHVLNLFNAIHARGHLITEVICDHPPTQQDAVAACQGFRSQVAIPKQGDRVRVTGTYVKDRENAWNEVHPATRIEILD